MNDEFEMMWKEAFMVLFKALSWHLLERLRKATTNPSRIACLQGEI
jgi:hypothetical protein